MSDLAHAIEMLSPEKRALLFQRLKERRGIAASASAIPRQSRERAHFPLSFAQQRLWFLDQWQPGSAVYNIALVLRLTGNLHISALQLSLTEIVRRHESLRTSFSVIERQPVQVIAASVDLPLPVIDLTAISEREQAVQQLALAEGQKPFDLAHAPLIRISLLRLDSNEHILLLTMHHIISDGWSLSILIRELTTFYPTFVARQPSLLPIPLLQYIDFAIWQQEQLRGEILEGHLSYWKQQLAGAPALLELPQQRARPPVQSSRGARSTFLLAPSLVAALQHLGQNEDVSLFMVLLAAFQVLLHRYTGQDDILIGTPIANRTRAEIENIMGFFVNTLTLRANFRAKPTFRELLKRVRTTTLEAYAHQDLPFEHLVEALQPERDLSYSPVFQILFGLQNAPTRAWHLPALTISEIPLHNATAKFDLMLLMEETEAALKGELTYNADLYDEATISRVIGHYQTLVESVIANPDQHIPELPLLTKAERQQILVAWNSTEMDYQEDACLHQLFERKATQQPDSIAIFYDAGQFTYDELNRRANQLAQWLRALGVGPEVVVGLCLERSLDMTIGILAILKAGGAYLPLDPQYPQERLAFMLQDAQVRLLLTQPPLKDILACATKAQIICLDDLAPLQNTAGASENPSSGVTGENLAYVIYTSGSTGLPKGIAIRHRGVVNNLLDLNTRFAVGAGDKALALSSPSFDMCVYELLGLLAAGGTVITPDVGKERDPLHWAELLVRYSVSIWNSAPSLLQLLVETVTNRQDLHPHCLRLALLGGDWLPLSLPDRLREVAADVQVVNLGGATEASIHSTIYPIERIDPLWKSFPYGRPMANQHTYILDAALQPVPVGVPGQLHLGGIGLARGYLNRPDLTAEKFIPHPLVGTSRDESGSYGVSGASEPGERIYQTGDLARWRPDGTIELLGRLDFQVKIRGLRVEPGEIAAMLRKHQAVQDAVIMTREDEPGNKRLVAYIVPRAGSQPNTTELWQFLNQALPDYMVPSTFLLLDTFPLSPNGKVDRQALPAPEQKRPDLGYTSAAPRSAVEEVLVGIWSNVLDVQEVGIHDNFFHLGGHSLLATQIVAQILETFQLDLPLRTLFAAPTIATLATRLAALAQAEDQDITAIAEMILRLNQLSEEDVQRLLAERGE